MSKNRPRRAVRKTLGLCFVGVLTLVLPAISYGLGLGTLKVNSALNEPLNAEIDFTSASKVELKSLNVGLAPRSEFNSAGVQRIPFLSDIKFTIAKRLDGRPFLQLSTEQPVREPFLHFLVQAEWAGGRMVREFTALIDPPYLIAGRTPAVSAPTTSAPASSMPPSVASAAPSPAPIKEETLSQPAPSAQVEPPAVAPSPVMEEPSSSAPSAPPPAPQSSEPLGPSASGEVAISPDTGWPQAASSGKTAGSSKGERGSTSAETGAAMPAMPEPSSIARAPNAPSWARVGRYEVKRGDTLWAIAQYVSVDSSLTTEQVVMALFEANRDAFFRNNVNNVWAGEVLIMPERDEVIGLGKKQAHTVFFAQYQQWQEYKQQLAQAQPLKVAGSEETAAATSPAATKETTKTGTMGASKSEAATSETATAPVAETETAQTAKPKTEATPPKPMADKQPEPKPVKESAGMAAAAPVPAAKPPGDLLRIVRSAIEDADQNKGKEGGTAGDASRSERTALAERATTLDEQLESKQMEQKDLGERIGTVGSQIERQKRLIELDSNKLAKTQEAVTESKPAAEAKVEPVTPPTPAEKPGTPPKAAGTAGAAKETPAAQEAKPEARPQARKRPRRIRSTSPGSPPAGKKPRRIVPPQPPAEEKGLIANLKDIVGDYLIQGVAFIVAIALGLTLLIYLRRRRQAEAEFEESILTDSDAITDSPTTDSGAQATTSAGSTSFLSDFSQGGMGNISTDEVDPLAETEVYLAYGRDEQAEEILKDAVAKDPSRQELKVKLLEIYHQRNDVPAFETLAEELYAALEGRGGELWNRVAEMGRRLNPDNPMFQGAAITETPSVTQPATAEAPMQFEPEPTEEPPALEFETATGDMTPAPGLDTDTQETAAADAGLEFDLDMDTGTDDTGAPSPAAGEPPIPDTAELSAEELGTAALQEEEEAVGLGEQPMDNMVDFDITDSGTTAGDTGEEAAVADADSQWQFESDSDVAVDEAVAEYAAGADDAQQWDETATKLDLAKAYVDMGDAEGARSILDEVLAEGNEDQKKQAAELAAQIA
jgi:pilus assembly protein FimV